MSSNEEIDRHSIVNNATNAEREHEAQDHEHDTRSHEHDTQLQEQDEQHHEQDEQHHEQDEQQNEQARDNEIQSEGDFGCGIGFCRPGPLQCCAQLLPFSIAYGVYIMVSQTISAYLSSQITTLEKRYGITSSHSGVILAANDIGYLATVLFITHYCRRYHIPRILSLFGILIGCCSISLSFPNFIDQPHYSNATSSESDDKDPFLCNPYAEHVNKTAQCNEDNTNERQESKWVVIFFSLIFVLQGIAKSPRVPLGTIYIDNSADKASTGKYLGISSTLALFGPFAASLLGGAFGKIPVNEQFAYMTPSDPRWIGAWWIGFLMFGGLVIIASSILFFFPRQIRQRQPGIKNSSPRNPDQTRKNLLDKIKILPQTILRLLRNPIYSLTLASNCLIYFCFIGIYSFGPKYMENVFNIPTWKTNLIQGGASLVSAVVGTFLGGYLTSQLGLRGLGSLKMRLIILLVVVACQVLLVLFGCNNHVIKKNQIPAEVGNTTKCDCHLEPFFPVCTSDGSTFFSPCHAGCSNVTGTVYYECSAKNLTATPGICDSGCPFLIPYVTATVIKIVAATMATVPTQIIILRYVSGQDKALGVGFMSFTMSLLVYLPAPLVIGKLFDGTCLIWKNICNVRGTCQLYNIEEMRVLLMIMEAGFIGLGTFLQALAVYIGSRAKLSNEDNKEIIVEV
ncbi:solute carrier organic anion transporter family member 2A1-like [Saccostrea cucullata]|uniref:solute carrier organic anion transporter family member 2A1-like n=1 Tax=Saccostrea cuccullata TaxID=36930 RepID=UPI002ED417FB